jgi:hypothetical protein
MTTIDVIYKKEPPLLAQFVSGNASDSRAQAVLPSRSHKEVGIEHADFGNPVHGQAIARRRSAYRFRAQRVVDTEGPALILRDVGMNPRHLIPGVDGNDLAAERGAVFTGRDDKTVWKRTFDEIASHVGTPS